jgi:hypothetical protein
LRGAAGSQRPAEAFLERIMEAFRQYTPIDPQADESRAAVMLAFVNQAAPDIRRKLQMIERLSEQSLQDLVRAAERVFNHRETPEEREDPSVYEVLYMRSNSLSSLLTHGILPYSHRESTGL